MCSISKVILSFLAAVFLVFYTMWYLKVQTLLMMNCHWVDCSPNYLWFTARFKTHYILCRQWWQWNWQRKLPGNILWMFLAEISLDNHYSSTKYPTEAVWNESVMIAFSPIVALWTWKAFSRTVPSSFISFQVPNHRGVFETARRLILTMNDAIDCKCVKSQKFHYYQIFFDFPLICID